MLPDLPRLVWLHLLSHIGVVMGKMVIVSVGFYEIAELVSDLGGFETRY